MVMLVFTLPSFPFVFKVIRDRFEPPKETDRRAVMDRYRMVKIADRAGRMADSLEFTDLALPAARFAPELLADVERLCNNTVERWGDQLLFHHVYAERRLVPLDMYLQSADAARAESALAEYGEAIKDLARANIFPGDLLLKNFGVTRFGRVLFYDYDEIVPLDECRFRSLPKPRGDDEEMAAEPFFNVEPNDVFPEQFPTFLVPPGRDREIFCRLHGDLADPRAWAAIQARVREGADEDALPYPAEMRFAVRYR
jgi:isocitrate dehydrogenase kinase/phosphatase